MFFFDSYMFACLLKNKNLIDTLSYDFNNRNWNLRPNKKYHFGTCEYITPFAAILSGDNNTNDKEILELFVHVGGYDLNQVVSDKMLKVIRKIAEEKLKH